MYSILLSLAVAAVVGGGGMLAGLWGWIWATVLGLVAFLVTAFVLGRRQMKRLGPAMASVQRQIEAQMLDGAMQSLRDMLPLGRWSPLLTGQLYAQMGVVAYLKRDEDEAVALLRRGSRRVADAQLLLASILYRRGDKQQAFAVLQQATAAARKHPMLHNAYAFLLHREQRGEEAQKLLVRYLKKQKDDEIGKDNLLRLQNNQRLSMKSFGMEWYALGIEQPPQQMGQLQTARKGFRTPPKPPKGRRR